MRVRVGRRALRSLLLRRSRLLRLSDPGLELSNLITRAQHLVRADIVGEAERRAQQRAAPEDERRRLDDHAP
eukprot:1655894-Prymnesium_polylepis.1